MCKHLFGDFDNNYVLHLRGTPSPSGGVGPESCDVFVSCSNWGSGTFSVAVSDRSSRSMHGFSLNQYTHLLDNMKSLESDVILMSSRTSHTQKVHLMVNYVGGRKVISSVSMEYQRGPSGGFVDAWYPNDLRCENLTTVE